MSNNADGLGAKSLFRKDNTDIEVVPFSQSSPNRIRITATTPAPHESTHQESSLREQKFETPECNTRGEKHPQGRKLALNHTKKPLINFKDVHGAQRSTSCKNARKGNHHCGHSNRETGGNPLTPYNPATVAPSNPRDDMRTTVDTNSTPSSAYPHSDTHLFRTASEDVIYAIIRQMSRRPVSIHWQTSIPINVLSPLLCGDGELFSVARRMFNGLRICLRDNLDFNKWHSPSVLWNSDTPKVLRAIGRNLTSLRLCTGSDIGKTETELFRTIAERCTNLVHLAISGVVSDDVFDALIAARSGELRTLEFDCLHSHKRINTLRRHGSGLTKVLIRRPASSLVSVMRVLAPSLHDLTLLFAFRNIKFRALFDEVRETCKKLIILKHRGEPSSSFASLANLLSSCGARLKSTNLSGTMNPGLLRKIYETNVNARVQLRTNPHNVSQAMRALGDRVESLEISYDIPRQQHMSYDLIELKSAVAMCPGLETLVLRQVKPELASDVLEAILSVPKRELRVLVVILIRKFNQAILDTIARYTGTLMTFKLVTLLPKAGAFTQIACANPQLQRVTVRFRESKAVWLVPKAVNVAIDVLLTLCTHTAGLRELTIHWGEEDDLYKRGKLSYDKRIADVCVPLRRRRVLLHIYGEDYNV